MLRRASTRFAAYSGPHEEVDILALMATLGHRRLTGQHILARADHENQSAAGISLIQRPPDSAIAAAARIYSNTAKIRPLYRAQKNFGHAAESYNWYAAPARRAEDMLDCRLR